MLHFFAGTKFSKIRCTTTLSFIFMTISACSPGASFTTENKNTQPATSNKTQSENVAATSTPQSTPSPAKSPEPTSTPKVPPYGTCTNPCSGAEKVFLNSTYNKWMKVVMCSPTRYDILMGESQSGPFYKIGDTSGHGQDHCELVNNNFAVLKSDDDVKSGNCPTCNVGAAGSVTNIPAIFGGKIFYRSKMGEQFTFADATSSGIHTSCWYECGVSF
ncbi:hypothetical protein EBR21_06435 [bacterium]|nr:hypothetical protein [bacterium]